MKKVFREVQQSEKAGLVTDSKFPGWQTKYRRTAQEFIGVILVIPPVSRSPCILERRMVRVHPYLPRKPRENTPRNIRSLGDLSLRFLTMRIPIKPFDLSEYVSVGPVD